MVGCLSELLENGVGVFWYEGHLVNYKICLFGAVLRLCEQSQWRRRNTILKFISREWLSKWQCLRAVL